MSYAAIVGIFSAKRLVPFSEKFPQNGRMFSCFELNISVVAAVA